MDDINTNKKIFGEIYGVEPPSGTEMDIENVLTALGPTCGDIEIYNARGMKVYDGQAKKILIESCEMFGRLKKMHVKRIRMVDIMTKKFKFTLKESGDPCSCTTIDDFPKKDMLLVDFLHFFDSKEILTIVDGDDVVFKDRQEYLMWTAEGELHQLAFRKVSWMEAANDGGIFVYLTKKEESDNING